MTSLKCKAKLHTEMSNKRLIVQRFLSTVFELFARSRGIQNLLKKGVMEHK